MATGIESPNFKKYGVPIYGASWIPSSAIKSVATTKEDADNRDGEDESPTDGPSPSSISSEGYLIFSGGGGEGRSGIPNALLLTHFDSAANSLSDQPIVKLGTGTDLPYRMAVHPGGEGAICSFPESCRWFDWDALTSDGDHKLGVKASDKILSQLENVGQQLAFAFSSDGSVLAVGGEDGKLRVFSWPSMELKLDEAKAHASIKDLHFSPDGKFLVSVGSGGPGRVWDVESSTPVAALSKENSEMFCFCRFSQSSDNKAVLYISAMQDRGGSIVKWDTSSWKRLSSKQVVRDPISSFTVSPDGKLLAIGTIVGDVVVIDSASLRLHSMVKKAHLGIVTALMFSNDSRALVSASMDSSTRVTIIKEKKENGMNWWIIILMVLLAVAMYYYAKREGFFP
ncbi:SEC12-like protein 2 [Impatiens glandulifera]|uniref:SEC12-like protein 2 n=1 Tax=Impatiens glandulifera TaxID=253017 RepID=UPI001FB14115|nr:SEC12-like protein 2 [Impatiens glandulifera]